LEHLSFKLDDVNQTAPACKAVNELNELKLVLRLKAIRVLYSSTKRLDRSTVRMGIDMDKVSHGDKIILRSEGLTADKMKEWWLRARAGRRV
jgi:hypothetical protein